jgi:hypothetical protein
MRFFVAIIFIVAVEYAIRRIQANQEGLKLNVTHHLLVALNNLC